MTKQTRREFEVLKAAHAHEDITYTTDAQGRICRVDTDTRFVLHSEIHDALTRKRVVDEEEMLEAVGSAWLKYFITKGYLVRNGHFFWITKRAAKCYGLINVTTDGMPFAFIDGTDG